VTTDQTPTENLFTCIDHVGYAVPNMDEAIQRQTEVFGWRVAHREINEEQGVEEAMLVTGDALGQNAQIQLLAPLNENSTIAKFIAKNGPGVQQVCYRVADLDHVSEVLTARGVRLLYPAPKTGTAGARINFIHPKDAGGILIELTQPVA
jgi:methylmalonyl-CoA/ethylmalonyl-CoA epimerase